MSNDYRKEHVQELIEGSIFPLLCLVFVVMFYFGSKGLKYESLIYPIIIMVILVVLFIVNFIGLLKEYRNNRKTNEPIETKKLWGKNYIKSIVLFISSLLYAIFMPVLGFGICTFIYLLILAYYLGFRRLVPLSIYIVISFGLIYGIFELWLTVNLPSGIIF